MAFRYRSNTFSLQYFQSVTNRDLTKEIAQALGRPLWLPPIPKFVLRLLFGEMAGLVLNGNKVSANKILDAGFEFKYPTIEVALKNLLQDS